MVKILPFAIFALYLLAVVEANNCSSIACEEGMCCQSKQNEEECCSSNTTCDVELGCVYKNGTDTKLNCPIGTTMCWTIILIDFCCPYPMAVCCSDWTHCCPHGYECDLVNMKCSLKNSHLYKRDLQSLAKFAKP